MFPWSQFLDIVDTAIKIGIGALISGVATYKLSKLNFESDIRKMRWLRHCETLEEQSVKAELFIQAWERFSARVSGIKHSNELNEVKKFWVFGFCD